MPRYIGEELEEGQTDILCLYNDFIGGFNDLLLVFTKLQYVNNSSCVISRYVARSRNLKIYSSLMHARDLKIYRSRAKSQDISLVRARSRDISLAHEISRYIARARYH